MSLSEHDLHTSEIDPIDIVESLAEHHAWEFDRIAEDQIAMAVEGQWRTYALTLAWCNADETLRLICSFDLDLPDDKRAALFEALNAANDKCWSGNFTYWEEQKLLVYRYGLILAGEQIASPDQIGTMIEAAVCACERFYPAFQLAVWGDTPVHEAMHVAIAEAYGRA
ncbi:YbjN domain-containing protein [Mangrovicoccus sp. HB161399]|uniref:YbjN domain-containing protein n=1 Tax=Mangrovicoccus sp. HB161399 TaxID=2720392 RepID=UPI001554F6E1|nr:YbjN domain-containing protein [Mangrovicoccus sp. HB161399]